MRSRLGPVGLLTLGLALASCRGGAEEKGSRVAEDPVSDTRPDSLRLGLEVPSEATAGELVPITIRVENVSDRVLELHLRGRTIAFDLIVSDPGGAVVWRRLHEEVLPGILRLEPLGPGAALELSDRWDQRDNDGVPVPSGSYVVRGELLTEGEALVTTVRRLEVVAERQR